ncbi:MAG: class I SAM-dependent methyltransferase [Bernardetiaceae bacterium]|jgi:hypothetical protein|nr:class I SAM-dependent methyltransferase [Bernardetiaceae bacterium]
MLPESYYLPLAAAYVRGRLLNGNGHYAGDELLPLVKKPFQELAAHEHTALLQGGLRHGFKMQRFRQVGEWPLADRILAALRGIKPDNLLLPDSGHGMFLWKLLQEFPFLLTTVTDLEARHIDFVQTVQRGGLANLRAQLLAAGQLESFTAQHFDVVLALQTLETAPELVPTLAELCRVARRFVIVSVSLVANPRAGRHLDEATLRQLLAQQGVSHLKLEKVDNYLLLVGRK